MQSRCSILWVIVNILATVSSKLAGAVKGVREVPQIARERHPHDACREYDDIAHFVPGANLCV